MRRGCGLRLKVKNRNEKDTVEFRGIGNTA